LRSCESRYKIFCWKNVAVERGIYMRAKSKLSSSKASLAKTPTPLDQLLDQVGQSLVYNLQYHGLKEKAEETIEQAQKAQCEEKMRQIKRKASKIK
jgi:hypothetical protein